MRGGQGRRESKESKGKGELTPRKEPPAQSTPPLLPPGVPSHPGATDIKATVTDLGPALPVSGPSPCLWAREGA